MVRRDARPACTGRPSCACGPCDRRLRRRADTASDLAGTLIGALIQAVLRG